MESFGEKLRKTREGLNYSIEQAARDTNIGKYYLIALENEDFSVFPGETYLKGFLKNYAEYLGLDGEELINIYKNIKIQEQPVPLAQLLENKHGKYPKLFIAVAGGVAAVLLLIVLLLVQPPAENIVGKEEKAPDKNEIVFNDYVKTFDIAKDTKIIVTGSGDKEKGTLLVKAVDNNLVISSGKEDFELALGMKKQIDLDGDGLVDLEIRVNDIYPSGQEKHAKIELLKLKSSQAAAEDQGDKQGIDIAELTSLYGSDAEVLKTASEPAPFTIDTLFSGSCYFIYYIDDKPREQKLMYANQTLSLPANTKADLRFSNAGSVTLKVAENQIQLGGFGQVTARLITWKKDEAKNSYYLLSLPLK